MLHRGNTVLLRAYGGKEISRRVVEETESAVYVCLESEYEQAEREGREPMSVGFPVEYLISHGDHPSGA